MTEHKALFCTLRTSALHKPVEPVRALLVLYLAGTVCGTALRTAFPAVSLHPLLTQGLLYSDALRTLWDVFCTAAVPVLLLLGGVLLLSGWGWGQPFLLLLYFWRAAAAGIAAADCYARFGLRTGICIAGTLIVPLTFFSALLLLFPLRNALALTCCIAEYLIKSNADPEIGAKQHQLVMQLLRAMLLTVPLAGLHTLLVWSLNGSFPAG